MTQMEMQQIYKQIKGSRRINIWLPILLEEREKMTMSRFKTIKEATEAWVHEMNAIPQGMISRLFKDYPDDWTELTKPSKYDRVYVFDNEDYGEIIDIDEETEEYIISLDNREEIRCKNGDFEVNHDDGEQCGALEIVVMIGG